MNERKMVSFDIPKLEALEAAYKLAVSKERNEFVFDGDAYLVDYAKYLIEYLKGQLK